MNTKHLKVLLLASLFLIQPTLTLLAGAEQNLEVRVRAIADHLLRDSLLALLTLEETYKAPAEGIGNPDDVFQIALKSQRVYVFYASAQVAYPDAWMKKDILPVVQAVYERLLPKLAWIPTRNGVPKTMQDDYKDIRKRFREMGLKRKR